MASCDEDLEFNPFYQALQSHFFSLYEQAQQNCWLVCIPTATSLGSSTITRQLIENHLLEPSGLLRDVYKATGPSKLVWRLCGGSLLCTSKKISELCVRVISEELAYNRALKQFKIFIVERPLDPSHKMPSGLGNLGGRNSNQRDALKRRKTYKEHSEFLQSFLNYREGLEELNKLIRLFLQNYLIVHVESLLLDTATKLEGMVKQGYMAFIEANRQDPKLNDKRMYDACWLSIEGYLMHHVHSKVFPAVCEVHTRQDWELSERCRLLRGNLTPSLVGILGDYHCPYPSTLRHLNSLAHLDTPLEMLYAIQDAMESVMEDVRKNFILSLRVGEPQPLASDDLIALMATILIQVDHNCLLSIFYYMENFHWSTSDSDQLSYILVTLRSAVEFLRGPDVSTWIPDTSHNIKPQQQPSPAPSSRSSDESEGHSSSFNLSLSTNASIASDESSSGWCVVGGNGLLPGSTHTQALSARMGVSEKEVERRHKRSHNQQIKEGGDLGPFLSRLLESDHVITSSEYDSSM